MSGTESRAPGHEDKPVTLRALLKPRQGRPGDSDMIVEAIARTGNGKVTVRYGTRSTWSAESWRLYDPADRSRRLAATDLARLPWNGKGPDPLEAAASTAPRATIPDLTPRSPPSYAGVSKGEQPSVGCPPFETRPVTAAPQGEDGGATARRA